MILLSCLLLQAITALEFRIPDGTKRDSYIGNLPQNANLKSSSDLRQFVIVTGSELIKVRDFYRIKKKNGPRQAYNQLWPLAQNWILGCDIN